MVLIDPGTLETIRAFHRRNKLNSPPKTHDYSGSLARAIWPSKMLLPNVDYDDLPTEQAADMGVFADEHG
jgi:hypothetical protein